MPLKGVKSLAIGRTTGPGAAGTTPAGEHRGGIHPELRANSYYQTHVVVEGSQDTSVNLAVEPVGIQQPDISCSKLTRTFLMGHHASAVTRSVLQHKR